MGRGALASVLTTLTLAGLLGGVLGGPDAIAATTPPAYLAPPERVGLVDPESGLWHLREADDTVLTFYFGDPGDIPFVGDWDCDGIETPGLYFGDTGCAGS